MQPPAKKQKLKQCLFEPENQFNQTQKFKLGKEPHAIQCYGLWICLAARSNYMRTIYKDNEEEPENLLNLHLMQEYPIDTPLKRSACEYAWNFIHKYPGGAAPSSSTQSMSLFQMSAEQIKLSSVEQWKELLETVVCLKQVLDYFQVSYGELAWSKYLIYLLQNCPIDHTDSANMIYLKNELTVILHNTTKEASSTRKKIDENFKRLQSQCSIDECTERICEASVAIENVCEFHFNCELVSLNYFSIGKLAFDLPHSKSIVRILRDFREINPDNANKREFIQILLAKLTICANEDGSSITMIMEPLTEKEIHLLTIRYKKIKSEQCNATQYRQECDKLTEFVERFNLDVDHIQVVF